jgi:hypothetical protein
LAARLSNKATLSWLFVLALFLHPMYSCPVLLNRGRRRSRRPMTEQGAAADNACRGWSVRRRRALRRGPRAPGPPPPSSVGSRKLGAKAGGSQRRPKGADRKAPEAPPGAPFPSIEGKRKKRRRARPGARKQNHGTAKRWLLDNQTGRPSACKYRGPLVADHNGGPLYEASSNGTVKREKFQNGVCGGRFILASSRCGE